MVGSSVRAICASSWFCSSCDQVPGFAMMYVFAPSVETSSTTRPRLRFWYETPIFEIVEDLVLEARDDLVHVLRLDAGRDELAVRADQVLCLVAHQGGVARAADRPSGATDLRTVAGRRRPALRRGEHLLVRDLAAERAVVDVHRDRLEEPAPVGVDLRASFLRPVVEQADARRPVVLQHHRVGAEQVAGERIDRVLQEVGVAEVLLLVAQADVERQVRPDLPRVANVRGPVERAAR